MRTRIVEVVAIVIAVALIGWAASPKSPPPETPSAAAKAPGVEAKAPGGDSGLALTGLVRVAGAMLSDSELEPARPIADDIRVNGLALGMTAAQVQKVQRGGKVAYLDGKLVSIDGIQLEVRGKPLLEADREKVLGDPDIRRGSVLVYAFYPDCELEVYDQGRRFKLHRR